MINYLKLVELSFNLSTYPLETALVPIRVHERMGENSLTITQHIKWKWARVSTSILQAK